MTTDLQFNHTVGGKTDANGNATFTFYTPPGWRLAELFFAQLSVPTDVGGKGNIVLGIDGNEMKLTEWRPFNDFNRTVIFTGSIYLKPRDYVKGRVAGCSANADVSFTVYFKKVK